MQSTTKYKFREAITKVLLPQLMENTLYKCRLLDREGYLGNAVVEFLIPGTTERLCAAHIHLEGKNKYKISMYGSNNAWLKTIYVPETDYKYADAHRYEIAGTLPIEKTGDQWYVLSSDFDTAMIAWQRRLFNAKTFAQFLVYEVQARTNATRAQLPYDIIRAYLTERKFTPSVSYHAFKSTVHARPMTLQYMPHREGWIPDSPQYPSAIPDNSMDITLRAYLSDTNDRQAAWWTGTVSSKNVVDGQLHVSQDLLLATDHEYNEVMREMRVTIREIAHRISAADDAFQSPAI